jgi:hypothetical protein
MPSLVGLDGSPLTRKLHGTIFSESPSITRMIFKMLLNSEIEPLIVG